MEAKTIKPRLTLKKNVETQEWMVVWYVGNKRDEARTYYTDDKADAVMTMATMQKLLDAEWELTQATNKMETIFVVVYKSGDGRGSMEGNLVGTYRTLKSAMDHCKMNHDVLYQSETDTMFDSAFINIVVSHKCSVGTYTIIESKLA